MYRLVFTRRASKALLKMPTHIAQMVREKLDLISSNPHGKHMNVARLQNHPGFRMRIGDWQVIYEVKDENLVILVVKIARRGEVYR